MLYTLWVDRLMDGEGDSGSVIMVYVSSVFQVRDGSTSSSPLLGTFCGVDIPPSLQSTQRSMYIHFKTDSSVSNHGFEAAYSSALEGKSCINICKNFRLTTLLGSKKIICM